MMKEIVGYCEETGQGTPEGLGEMAMAIYNGLTEEYRKSVKYMEEITGKTVSCINMVGGGIQDQLLCELTAKKTGKRVMAGPVEGIGSGQQHGTVGSHGRNQGRAGGASDYPGFL